MPTTRGWAALGAGFALVVLWIVFGERLMLAVGLFLVLAISGGMAYVRSTVPRVGVTRRLTPFQVHDGDRAVVEVTLITGRRIAQATILDEVSGLGTARFVADRIEPHDPMTARYEVLCRPRGIYMVGPAVVQVRDPLALTEAGGTAGRIDRLVVYPAVEDLEGLPLGRGHDPTVNTSRSSFSQTGGEDFFTLREYQQGDDLRKVHWPSTAKRDELMIRQLEMPWQSRALVLLDPRASAYPDSEAFEQAVRVRHGLGLDALRGVNEHRRFDTCSETGTRRRCGRAPARGPSSAEARHTGSPWRNSPLFSRPKRSTSGAPCLDCGGTASPVVSL